MTLDHLLAAILTPLLRRFSPNPARQDLTKVGIDSAPTPFRMIPKKLPFDVVVVESFNRIPTEN